MFLLNKSENFENRKTRQFDEERVYFEKKCAFIFLKGIFNKIGGAENMPVVAGCLVSSILVEICSKFILFNNDLTLPHGFNSTKAAAAK